MEEANDANDDAVDEDHELEPESLRVFPSAQVLARGAYGGQ